MHKTTYKRKQALLKSKIAKARKQHKKSSHLIREMKSLELEFYGGFSGIISHVLSRKRLVNKMKKAINADNPLFRRIRK